MIPVGVDFNLRAIAVAVGVRRGYAREVLGALARLSARYEASVYVLRGGCYFAALLPLVPPFREYVAPRVESLVEKYVGELEVLRALGLGVRLVEPVVPGVPERVFIEELVRKRLSAAGLGLVPELFNVELGVRVRKAERKWKLAYRHAITGRCFAVGRAVKELLRLGPVVVKVEDLVSINRKVVANPRTARWCYGVMLRTLLAALPRAVRVGYVDPAGTSSLTPCCGARARRESYRALVCPVCGRVWHRDIMAAINICGAKVTRWLR